MGGPTGAGKTGLALKIAQDFKGEMINADSVQLYKELQVGANKSYTEPPTHLIDILSIKDDPLGAGDFSILAMKKIKELITLKKVPIVVGGSGFFIQCLLNGPPPTPKVLVKNRIDKNELKEQDNWEEQ